MALGATPGTLGPHSFGFVNVWERVAPFSGPLPSLPRRGGLALVLPDRAATPDIAPLVLARNIGVSFLVSVGQGDPAAALQFLGADAHTSAVALALHASVSASALRRGLGLLPTVVLGGEPLARAVARHHGAVLVDHLVVWLAWALVLALPLPGARALKVIVVGGGRTFVDDELTATKVQADVEEVDERDADAIAAALSAHRDTPVLLVAGEPALLVGERVANAGNAGLLWVDLRHPAELRALFSALGQVQKGGIPRAFDGGDDAVVAPPPALAPTDAALAARVRGEVVDGVLSDHDAKRLLKAWGARVTRQAPTATPTGAAKLAKEIGLPVALRSTSDEVRVADTLPEVRRLAALLLQNDSGVNPSVMVQERFADAPRSRVRVEPERGVGLLVRVGHDCALAPLSDADALLLASSTLARRAPDQEAVAALLQAISRAAAGEQATFELELFVGTGPAVLRAAGSLRR